MSASGFAQIDLLRTTGQFKTRYRFVVCPLYYARLLKADGYTGTPSEKSDYDPGFLTDSSTDAVLLKELKSIIQEHSTHRPFSILRAVYRNRGLNDLLHRPPPRRLTQWTPQTNHQT